MKVSRDHAAIIDSTNPSISLVADADFRKYTLFPRLSGYRYTPLAMRNATTLGKPLGSP